VVILQVLELLQNKLALGSLAYLSMICYGASIGGVYHSRIYTDCILISYKLVFENPVFEFLDSTSKQNQFLEIVKLMLPHSLAIQLDNATKIWFESNSNSSFDIKQFQNYCYLTIIELTTMEQFNV
jgi:hypothetical protein